MWTGGLHEGAGYGSSLCVADPVPRFISYKALDQTLLGEGLLFVADPGMISREFRRGGAPTCLRVFGRPPLVTAVRTTAGHPLRIARTL